MIRPMPWHSLPSIAVREALPELIWQKTAAIQTPAANTSALMLYVALRFMAINVSSDEWVATVSYDELERATGLSRRLVSDGLKRLNELDLIESEGSNQKRRYKIVWSEGGWFKLPCQRIVSGGAIIPFQAFSLRSKHELHALKIYLYLASVRNGTSFFSSASYEKIYERVGVQERDIAKASSLLLTCGLLARVTRQDGEQHSANQYFLQGYEDFMKVRAA